MDRTLEAPVSEDRPEDAAGGEVRRAVLAEANGGGLTSDPGAEEAHAVEGGGEAGTDGAGGDEAGGEGGEGAGLPGSPGISDEIPPTPLHLALPALPHGLAVDAGRGGIARLLIYIDEKGEVRDVKLLSSTGIEALDRSAVDAARRMRYRPGSRRGAPAAMWTEAEVLF
jgi:TonB family protein